MVYQQASGTLRLDVCHGDVLNQTLLRHIIQLHWMGKSLTRRTARLVSDFPIQCRCIMCLHVDICITISITGVLVRDQGGYPYTKWNRFKEIQKLLQPVERTP